MAVFGINSAGGVGLTYVDADPFFSPNLSPTEALELSGTPPTTDNLWGYRTNFGAGTTIFESGLSEDSPVISQGLTGLVPNQSYDVYAVYWTDKDESWTVRTGTTPGSLALYSFSGPAGGVAGSTKGITAGAAVWDAPPAPTVEGTTYTQRPADPLVMLLAKAGTANANGSGELAVYVDDGSVGGVGAGGANRTWFDGIAYANAGTQIALTASIDRTTGALTITNPTSQNFQIKAITLDSPNGALSTTGWTPVSGRLDANGNMTFDTDVWNSTPPATTPMAVQLAEAEDAAGGGSGGALATGGSLGLGNVWVNSPFEDVRLSLTLTDDTLAIISPQFTGGAPIARADFNRDGSISLDDFQILLTNLHTSITAPTNAGAFLLGDMTSDRAVNFNDFAAFRTAYDAAHGAGAFEAVVAQVPEPSSLAILLVAGATCYSFGRRRAGGSGRVLLACCLAGAMSGSASAIEIAIDIDSTRLSGTDIAGPLSTQSGFTSWNLTDVATNGSMTTVEGVTFEIFGLNGANQTRVRVAGGLPNGGGGPFNDLLADLLYNEGANGRAIGLRITGLPVGTYAVDSWHFDAVVTAEATQVEVRNMGEAQDPSHVILTGPWSESPLEYLLEVKQPNQVKEIIFREASGGNRARLNGFTIGTAIEMSLEVNTTTGAMRMVNEQDVTFDLSYYDIRSPSGALNLGGWSSLDDSEGGDPVGTGWDEAGGISANILSEVNLQTMQTFVPDSSASLGNPFSVGGAEDIRFFYASPTDTLPRQGIVTYVTGGGADADYDNDSDVDGNDFLLWQRQLGASVTPGTGADGSGNGTVDAPDLSLWRSQFGTPATAAAAAVPEPGSLGLLALAGVALLSRFRSKR